MDFLSPWIHTTEKCNLNCHYCYVTGNKTMSPEVYRGLENLLLSSPDTDRYHLRFAGGEPTLVFDIWESFARRMLEHKGTTVEVLTNLISPSKSFWKFTELDRVNLSVSVDNGRSVKKLDKSMAEKLERLPEPWIMTTLTTDNIQDMEVMAAFIGMNNYGWAITTDYFEKTMPHWEEVAGVLLRMVSVLREFNYDFNKISFNNFSARLNFSGCKAGAEMFSVYCDGGIYKCQTLFKNSKRLGDVFNGYEPSPSCSRAFCKNCPIDGLCRGWCPIYYKVPNPLCNAIKLFAEEIIKETSNAK